MITTGISAPPMEAVRCQPYKNVNISSSHSSSLSFLDFLSKKKKNKAYLYKGEYGSSSKTAHADGEGVGVHEEQQRGNIGASHGEVDHVAVGEHQWFAVHYSLFLKEKKRRIEKEEREDKKC